jgi:hypothetical protein
MLDANKGRASTECEFPNSPRPEQDYRISKFLDKYWYTGNYELTARMKVVREYYNGPVILGQDLMAFEVGDQVKVINK